ncbi:hypothetical protein F7725_015352 [Dissostichus mawsoni]|uniref:Uncharacterized protein n=1 Tax=Dissostichus mawsoni TaxID=36200 RepID=A0A7J5YHC8_DISMA|nr:hypothetical protein F7725_015352 [Dissostichus mawsoni]
MERSASPASVELNLQGFVDASAGIDIEQAGLELAAVLSCFVLELLMASLCWATVSVMEPTLPLNHSSAVCMFLDASFSYWDRMSMRAQRGLEWWSQTLPPLDTHLDLGLELHHLPSLILLRRPALQQTFDSLSHFGLSQGGLVGFTAGGLLQPLSLSQDGLLFCPGLVHGGPQGPGLLLVQRSQAGRLVVLLPQQQQLRLQSTVLLLQLMHPLNEAGEAVVEVLQLAALFGAYGAELRADLGGLAELQLHRGGSGGGGEQLRPGEEYCTLEEDRGEAWEE